MDDPETTDRIVDVLRDAEEPLSASDIQRRLARRSRDVTTGVIRATCEELAEEGRLEATDATPTRYRPADGG